MKSILVFGTFYCLVFGSCVSTRKYARAEEKLCDCHSGLIEPADEFCMKYNKDVQKKREKLDRKMKTLSSRNPEKALRIQIEIDSIKADRAACVEAVSNY